MREDQRRQRTELLQAQATRADSEFQGRVARFRRGFRGLWDRVTARHAQIRREHEAEFKAGILRDRAEHQFLIKGQLRDRRLLQQDIKAVRRMRKEDIATIHLEIVELDTPSDRQTAPDRDIREPGVSRRNRNGPAP